MEEHACEPKFTRVRRAEAAPPGVQKPCRAEVEAAVRTIIQWAGENSGRDGLIEIPARVTCSFEEFFAGDGQDPVEILEKTFEEIEGYDEMIVLRTLASRATVSTTWRRSRCSTHRRADRALVIESHLSPVVACVQKPDVP
jgi:GTP cyclohydrolase I-like protein